jgi:hypothetical protein
VLGYGDAVLVDLEDGRQLGAAQFGPGFHRDGSLVVEILKRVWTGTPARCQSTRRENA